MLSAVGTLVVLLTFVVKEQLRETWKQRAEVVEAALARDELLTELNKIDAALNQPEEFQDHYQGTRLVHKARALVFGYKLLDNRYQADDGRYLAGLEYLGERRRRELEQEGSRAEVLAGALPHGEEMLRRRTDAEFMARGWELKFEDRLYLLAVSLYRAQHEKRSTDEIHREIFRFYDESTKRLEELTEPPHDMYVALLSQAEEQVKVDKKHKQEADWIVAGLFLLGVVLNIAGKFAGNEREASAVE